MVHIWGVLGSISGPHCWVNKNRVFKKGVAKLPFSFCVVLVVVGGCYY